ncbi:MAG: FtsX-like permease family protein [Bacteroidetes bacterium]|nr:FtsX-like permease family protein [Bacteroidota bacterium]MBT4401081.1 FtsX-like permease family protein [Bacteroidota bacterium]MBT4408637.1 FtsX-like permease family protein [Bacteroidota bacterium]MBT5427973.1 FtsX-like permease family protein [Bacteroidota bacterium]MBT7465505.1 FtsX-like permease family protein [Bacteroidota bacterium]
MFLLNLRLSISLLLKRPVVTGIKLLGLTIGVAVATLLMVYADQEFSYDSHFKNSDRIYRSLTTWKEGSSIGINPICLRSLYEGSTEALPEVESVVQIYRGGRPDIRIGDQLFKSKRMLYADPEFVDVFTPKQIAGDIRSALSSPGTLVITDRLARILFGTDNPIGKNLVVNEMEYSVEAVMEEFPYNTHFKFDFLAAMVDVDYLSRMGGLEFFTYTLFREGVDLERAVEKASDFYEGLVKQQFQQIKAELGADMEPLTRIHLFTTAGYDLSPNGDVTIILSLTLLAILILILALSNYINLFLVHSENRSLEIGIRKASGSGQKRLLGLFFGESLGITLISFILALILLHSTANWIRTTFLLSLDPEIWSDPGFYLKVCLLMLITAALAGLYPAFYLSRLNPVRAIFSSGQGGSRKNRLMRIAVVFQFSITVFLITGIGFLYKQMNYISTVPLGFDAKGVLMISNLNSTLVNNQDAIKEALVAIPDVEYAGASQGSPASGKSGQLIYKFGETPETAISIAEERVRSGYFETLGIELLAGRFFREGSEYDSKCVILNETAVQRLGLDNPIGSRVAMFADPVEVIGVVKDFHFRSLKSNIGPLVFTFYNPAIYIFMVKALPGNEAVVMKKVREVLAGFDSQQEVSISFLDNQIRNRYNQEQQLSRILLAGALLAIILSVMGLFALSLFSIQDRTKEIGVRKVLGGSISAVTGTLVWSITKWTLIAIPIGAIPAYWVMAKWLANFAYKTNLSWWMFIPAGCIAVSIALLTVIFQVIRVANKNPVESLRYE